MADRKIKFLELADLLEKELGQLSAGSPATTLNDLIERFKVSRGTAKRTLLELQQRGIIYSRVGAGSFVAPQQRKKMILIVFDLNLSLATSDMFNEKFLVRALICCNMHHPQYTVAAMDFADFSRDHEHLEVLHPRLKGVVFLRYIDQYREAAVKLEKRGIACAFYGSSAHRSHLDELSYLIYNEENIIKIILGVLQQRSCAVPGFAGSLGFAVHAARLEAFRKYVSRFGMQYSARRVLNIDDIDWQDRKALRRYFNEIDCLIAADDGLALRMHHAATRLGFRIPEDLAITGINNVPYLELLADPGITTVELDTENDAERVINLLITQIETGKQPFRQETVLRLIRRDSA